MRPSLNRLIADEPTTVLLDVMLRATILASMWEIRDRRSMAILFITHANPFAPFH